MDWAAGIRRLRMARGWKQAALAEHLGVDQATISRWERGVQLPGVAIRRALAEMMSRDLPDRDLMALMPVHESPNDALAFDRSLNILAVSVSLAAEWGGDRRLLVGSSLKALGSTDMFLALAQAESAGFWGGGAPAVAFVAALKPPEGGDLFATCLLTPLFLTSGEVAAKVQSRRLDSDSYRHARRHQPVRVLGIEGLCVSRLAILGTT